MTAPAQQPQQHRPGAPAEPAALSIFDEVVDRSRVQLDEVDLRPRPPGT